MKKMLSMLAVATLFATSVQAEEEKKDSTAGYEFTTIKECAITPIKNQNRSSTCWSFSAVAFLESELLRTGKGEHDLSEMFIVHHCLTEKAEKYVRLQGSLNFAPGGSFDDVLCVLNDHGAVPEEIMNGLNYGEEKHMHNEMDKVLKSFVDVIIKQDKLTTAWKSGFAGIVNSYLGEVPEEFTYNGVNYTPKSYAASLGLKQEDYISLTSYTHQPFYEPFVLEIPDNWRWSYSYNLPIDELMEVIENAVMSGYTVAWGSDVSEKGFTRDGIAVAPVVSIDGTSGSDQARWVGLSRTEKASKFEEMIAAPCEEIVATQEMRQAAYDNYETTDDHGMLIYGIAKDQTGKKYYMVKNSWSDENKYKGTWYVSENFVRYKTMNIVVSKEVLSKKTKKQLNVK